MTTFENMKQIGIPSINLDVAYPKITLLSSGLWAAFANFTNTYVFNDWSVVPFLIVIIGIDTITGVWKSILKHDFSSYSFGGFMTKIVLYSLFLIMVHVLTSFSTNDAINKLLFDWAQQGAYAAIFIRESLSIVENIGHIKPKLLPSWILKRLRDFDENGLPKQ